MSHSLSILFISSSPRSGKHIRAKEEFKIIKKELKNVDANKLHLLLPEFDVSPEEFLEALEEQAPKIVHFSGHGFIDGEPIFETIEFERFILKTKSFLSILKEYSGIKCLFFNSCNSTLLIQEAVQYIDFGIGIKGTISEETAIKFANHFYKSLKSTETIPLAYWSAVKKLRLLRVPDFSPVFSFHPKFKFTMKQIISDYSKKKLLDSKNKLNQERLLEEKSIKETKNQIVQLENNFNKIKKENIDEFLELLEECPFPRLVFWFYQNKNSLCEQISEQLFVGLSTKEKKYFSEELMFFFNFIEASMVTFDIKGISVNHIHSIPRSFKKKQYIRALGILKISVPKLYESESILFFKENVAYIEKLLKTKKKM